MVVVEPSFAIVTVEKGYCDVLVHCEKRKFAFKKKKSNRNSVNVFLIIGWFSY